MASKLLVEIASYNTNLQGHYGLPQDLVDWLAPTLKVSSFLAHGRQAPDIVAVGFQELLPLPLGLAGLSRKVIDSRDALIRSQIEEHAPNKESYMLVAKIVNVGVALLVYVRDEEIGRRVCDVQTQWTGCGPAGMGNKGAVGARFRLKGDGDNEGETFTFVNAHLTAHSGNLEYRIADYKYIVGTLLFPPPPSTSDFNTKTSTTIYDTSHLFFFGDLNFRLTLPSRPSSSSSIHSSDGNGLLEPEAQQLLGPATKEELYEMLKDDVEREKLKELDELFVERRKGRAFVGLHEGEFWQFKCSYKYEVNEVDKYSTKRLPAWTDRVMYASYFDTPDKSLLEPVLYTSIPSYTTSDHKPVVALLKVPTHIFTTATTSPSPPPPPPHRIPIPPSSQYTPTPDPYYILKRYTGRVLDRLLGGIATLLWFVGLGNAALGVLNFVFGVVAWRWFGLGSRFGFGGSTNGYGSGNESGGVGGGGGEL